MCSAVLDRTVTTAQYDHGGMCKSIHDNSFSGNIVFHVGRYEDGNLPRILVSGVITLLVDLLIYHRRLFRELEPTQFWEG